MAKKRGGLAGIWDRNKQIIKPLATGVAGALTGGVGAAALGGLMAGLDRKGKSGIGFDLKQGAKGAIQGYGAGATGAGIKGLLTGGLKSNMTAMEGMRGAMKNYNRLPFGMGSKAVAPGAEGLQRGTASMNKGLSMLDNASDLPDVTGIGSQYVTPMPSSLFGKDGMIEQNKTILSGVGKGIMGVRQGALDQQAADAALNQRKYEFDKTYGIDAAQEADRKRREDELMAQRAAFRAMFTGTA